MRTLERKAAIRVEEQTGMVPLDLSLIHHGNAGKSYSTVADMRPSHGSPQIFTTTERDLLRLARSSTFLLLPLALSVETESLVREKLIDQAVTSSDEGDTREV